jgi:ubiquinone biosynthesis monooxygenase Coq7
MPAALTWPDRLIAALDEGLRAVAVPATATRPSPAEAVAEGDLSAAERRQSAALMRVNHAGEIAAQALYHGQSLVARSDAARELFVDAAREERDHLAWCAARIDELGGRVSRLTPFWYAGSFCVGVLAGAADDARSLGFVSETERQVEAHLRDHLRRLPPQDAKSAAILARMREDEVHHGTTATLAGGTELPGLVRRCMALGGEILRRVSLVV